MKRNIAIITGATSGLGKCFAQKLASKGLNLIITGRREALLNELASKIKSDFGVEVEVVIGDFADKNHIDNLCKKLENIENIEYLVNNAGYGNRDAFFEGDFDEQQKMITVHIYAVSKLTHTVGNKMKNQKFGNIINTSSLASFYPIPAGEFYVSSKSFINSFTESVFITLRNYNIKVQALCPGFIYTDFHRKLNIADTERKNIAFIIRWMTPEKVVEISLKNLRKKDKVIVTPGICNTILYHFSKIIPKSLYYKNANSTVKIPGKK